MRQRTQRLRTEDNPSAFHKMWIRNHLRCSWCPPNRGENAGSKTGKSKKDPKWRSWKEKRKNQYIV